MLSFVGLSVWLCNVVFNNNLETKEQSYIISANSYPLLQAELALLNAKPTHQLAIINAVAVSLNSEQLSQLQAQLDVQVTQNYKVELAGGKSWVNVNGSLGLLLTTKLMQIIYIHTVSTAKA